MCRRQPGIGKCIILLVYVHYLLKRGIVSYWPIMREVRWEMVRIDSTTAQNDFLMLLYIYITALYVIRT